MSFVLPVVKMSENILKFKNVAVDKKEFHKSKQLINLDLVNVDQILISDKFKYNDGGFKHFIDYKEHDIAKPLCITLPQMSWYIKYFENGGKNMSFIIKNDRVLDNYTEIWNKIKKILNIKFHSMPAYDEKYIKAKVKGSNGVAKSIFSSWNTKGKPIYAWIALISIDSLIRMKKKNYPQVYFEECK